MEVEEARTPVEKQASDDVQLRTEMMPSVQQLLQDRLYDQPENSHVLQAVRKGHHAMGAKVPRPPSGKPSSPSRPFRTTMTKQDYNQWQNKRRQSLHHNHPLKNLSPLHKTQSQPSLLTEDLLELDKITRDAESKRVTFTVKEDDRESLPPMEGLTRESTYTPLADSPCSINRRMSSKGSRKPDPSVVLTYMNKNTFDDTAPEKDDLVETVLEMRKALGWNIELPRLGSEGRTEIENMPDKPDPETDFEGAMNAKDDDGKFVYALPRNRNDCRARYNPYELQVVSANTARSCKIYWTASASNISRVTAGGGGKLETSSTPVMLWLWERRLFDLIYKLPVFQKYRKWKSFKAWKSSIDKQKHGNQRLELNKSLFTCNEILQGCLLHIRKMCEAASGSLTGVGDGDYAINLYLVDLSQTRTLKTFLEMQSEQSNQALAQLLTLKDTVVALVWECCAAVAEMEGVVRGIRPGSPNLAEQLRREQELKARLEKEEEENKLSPTTRRLIAKHLKEAKPEEKNELRKNIDVNDAHKPSYAQIVEWRKVLKRLSQFLRMVDFVMMEMLQRLVLTAVGQLYKTVSASYSADAEDMDEVADDARSAVSGDSGNLSRTSSPFKRAQSPNTAKSGTSSSTSGGKSFQRYTIKSSSSKHKKNRNIPIPLTENSGYVIPHFDFDKPDDSEKSIDMEQVLEEIAEQPEIEEACEPMLFVELVLKVPQIKSAYDRRKSLRLKQRRRSSQADAGNPLTREILKKAVTFTGEQDPSASDSDYDSEENESTEGEELKDVKSWEDDVPNSARNFAYHSEDLESHSSEELAASAFVVLSPSEDQVQYGVRSLVTTFENTVGQFGSLLKEPRLKTFYSPPKYDLKLQTDEELMAAYEDDTVTWPDTNILFGSDPVYQSVVADIMDMVKRNLEETNAHSEDFLDYCKMVDLARKFQVDQSIALQWSPEEFQQVLLMYTNQVVQMENMTREKRVGLMHVMTENFCEWCLPYPQSVVTTVWEVLPTLALKRNEDLLTIIEGALKKLDKTPTSVEEFVEHLSFLGKMASEMPALEKEYAIVTKLYTIAKDFDVPLNPEDLALYQTLNPSFQHLKSTILYAEAKKDDNIRKFSTHLGRLINDIRRQIMDIKIRVIDPSLLSGDTMSMVALERIKYLTEQVTSLTTKARSYGNYQERFGSSLNAKKSFSEEFLLDRNDKDSSAQEMLQDLSEIERDLTLRGLLWQSQGEWDSLAAQWTDSVFDELNVESLQKNVNRFTQTVYMLEKSLPSNEVVPKLQEKVTNFKQVMPVVTSLRNPSLKGRHWEEIERIIGRNTIREDKAFTLGNLLEMNINRHKDKIQDISTTASNEATLERMLQKVVDVWQATDFRLVNHPSGIQIIAGADDILALLEESQVTIGTIRGSRYVTPIKGNVEDWERRLTLFARTLDEWMMCQRNWLYLEQIFTTPDIQRQLPNEYKMFSQVDKTWKDIMRRTEDRPNALRSATAPGVLEMLQSNNTNLEKIQKCLEEYLETKRLVFPRFYFLSNDEMLDILAQSKNPDAVQPHLVKCFGNIRSLEIKIVPRQPPTVRSISSAEGETISMPRNVRARGPVEQWLCSVETGMFDTVKKHLKVGLQEFTEMEKREWVTRHPGQVVLTVSQIEFNKDVVLCLSSDKPRAQLTDLRNKMVKKLTVLAGLVTSPLSPHKRLSINALLTVDVHNRDIINSMIENDIARKDDFEWTRQLRYEWDEQSNNCNVLQSNACFVYGYEYLGCSPRLVITPLTDRCYLTLTGALHLHLGGSPAGPAGTGKTETVKDLAKAMGKQCVVFNCSEGLDFKMLGKFFSGMAQSGSWCCFDEFNRIDLEVLSVVAQQIHTIKTAKDQQALRFLFEGRDIRLNMTCGAFITMNPSYAGRVELPDNLKSLFRQVAMMVPDYALIAEIMLFSEGFTAAKSLSTKIVNLYQLASKQLSQQDHYDFGMRAIKSVLVMAGQKKRQVMSRARRSSIKLQSAKTLATRSSSTSLLGTPDSSHSYKEEAHILIHSLRDANLPKFLAEDVPLFESILDDLFPGIKPPLQDVGVLEKAISMAVRDLGLQHWPSQTEKVKQLYNQILVRHGVMMVGPTGGGKTAVRDILQRALVLLPMLSLDDNIISFDGESQRKPTPSTFVVNRGKKGHVEVFMVNPKCVSMGELYGETDPNTFEWTDGLIAAATRRFAKQVAPTLAEESKATSSLAPSSVISAVSVSSLTSRPVSSMSNMEMDGGMNEEEKDGEKDEEIDEELDEEKNNLTHWKWMVLDGPVDTTWVENLNTVLDDSKILCLANGERISLTSNMRLIFEVDDLSKASPATISRCAMVYMDPADLGWTPFVQTWLAGLPREMPQSGRHHIQLLLQHTLDKGVKFLTQHSKYLMMPTPYMCAINCLCNILSAYFDYMAKNGGFGSPDKVNRSESVDTESQDTRSAGRDRRRKKSGKKHVQIQEDASSVTAKSPMTKIDKSSTNKQYFLHRNPNNLTALLNKLFVFAFTWGFGGNFRREDDMDDDGGVSRRGGDKSDAVEVDIASDFDNFVRELFEVEPPIGIHLPASSQTIYSYFVDLDSGNFVPWDSLVSTTQSLIERGAVITIGETMGVSSGQQAVKTSDHKIVATVDTVRYSFLTALLLLNKNPVLLTGESGVGKSAIMKDILIRLTKDGGTSFKSGTVLGSIFNYTSKNQLLLDNISSLTKLTSDGDDQGMDAMLGMNKPKQSVGVITSTVQFSAQTSSHRVQQALTQKLIKKGRDTLGAPKGKKVLLFVDDLNMPAPEQYGAQPPLELLRQFMDMGGFYDTTKLLWKDILDVTLVAACGPPGGGRNDISPRLVRHFCMLAFPQPSARSLQHIYQVQLGRYFQENDFVPDVKEMLFPLVSAGIAIYYRMTGAMKPTPAKIHYTFNMRDLSQVIRGLMQADATAVVNSDNCAQLFAHEATRVFHDRLTDLEDRTTFFAMLSDTLHDFFKVKWTPEKLQNEPFLFADFLDVHDDAKSVRFYRQLTDYPRLLQNLEEYYLRQNIGNSQAPQLVFFKYAVEHILRAARVFRQPGGHMLMVGLDGTGKSTVVQLASYIAGCELYKLTLTRGYSLADFREDLKKVCRKAGVEGSNIVFLLSDGDIAKESFLEDINCILNTGEVPDLFDHEEMDGISMELKNVASEAQVPDTRVQVYEFFIQRVKAFLHVVLTMSPAGAKFRQRCRMNPSLINCCTIDWFEEWDKEACLQVAQVYFSNAEFITQPGQDLKELKQRVAERCVEMHRTVAEMTDKFWEEMRRRFYVTPSSYIEFIRIYTAMLFTQKTQFVNNKERLLVGLSRLSEANVLVGTMQEELVGLGPQIEEKAKATEVLLAQLEKDQEAVDEVRALVEAEEATMNRETQVVHKYADECQQDLASVLPVLQQAIQSLDALDKADIAEIRVYNHPPEVVVTVMSAVCVLLGVKPDWASAKLILADPQFLRKLVNFDKATVSDKVFQKVKRYSQHPEFTPEKVSVVSEACKSMCQWVLALERYHEVYKMAKPKQKRVEEAKEALKLAQDKLALKQASLNKIQQHIAVLQQQYQDSVAQREGLKERKKLTALRLERASVLITALSDEKVRWASLVEELDSKLLGIVGDTLLSAGAVAYLGAFNSRYRQKLISAWLGGCNESNIPVSVDYELIRNMASPNQVMQWHNSGLPQDTHSTENAIVVLNASKWPLLIDPQGQGSSWIKEMEGNKLKIVGAGDPNFMRTMERAIRVGEPVLLQDVTEDLDPSLKPILLQETTVRGGHFVIKLGDTEIEYNENFKLYMSTGLSNPHYLPSVCINTTIINFTVTFEGLQEQLLSSVVKQERPLLEKERTELLNSIAADLQLLRDLEDKTLSLLQNSQGNILDDQDLIETLQKSKGMSTEIHDRVEQSEDAEKELNTARQKYLPVAARGAVLYFVLADLANVDVMYQFSLNWFKELFVSCIRVSHRHELGRRPTLANVVSHGPMRPSSERRRSSVIFPQDEDMTPSDLASHMKKMIDKITSNVYRTTSMGLFAKHQLMFSFVLVTSVMRSNAKNSLLDLHLLGNISEEEWTCFLQGDVVASLMDQDTLQQHDGLTPMQRLEYQSKGAEPTKPKFISGKMWQQLQYLEVTFVVFSRLLRSVRSCQEQWEYLALCDDPVVLMSKPWDNSKFAEPGSSAEERLVFPWQDLTTFQRLLLIKILRPDMLMGAVRTFVHDVMGPKFVSTGTIDLREVFEESSAKAPLIFILSPGSDPASQLLRFARDLRGSTLHLDMISLGRGQGPRAEEFISKAQILKGRWLFLQNCHLAASWMPKLQTIVDSFGKPDTDVDPQFRLWLSSKPDPSFPISILQTGIKMTVEPPGGVKANLQRSFGSAGSSSVSERLYEEVCVDKPAWKSLLLGLCFFNAVIHERKKYGRLGWNIPYEFNDSDLEVSVLQLQMLLGEHETIPWPALLYLTGEVTYGGRVTDDNDRRCLHSLLQKFYQPKALSEDYVYSPDKVYHPLPSNYSYGDVKNYIDSLPEADSPELCGMNQNAEKAYLEDQSLALLATILNMQPRLTSKIIGSKKSNDELVVDMAQEMLSKIPPQVETDDEVLTSRPNQQPRPSLSDIASIASGAYFKTKGKTSSALQKSKALVMEESTAAVEQIRTICSSALFIVLRQEIDNFTSLVQAIHKSLQRLIKAVKGEIVMSLDLEEAYSAILNHKVPLQWKQISYESCKTLGAWVSDLVRRVDFFSEWCEVTVSTADKILRESQQQPQQPQQTSQAPVPPEMSAENPVTLVAQTLPRSFWLSAFFFPQGFLTAVLQNHARKLGMSVDSLHLQFSVKPSSDDVEQNLAEKQHAVDVKELGFKGAKGPEEGVYVFGLYLDGARWDLSTSCLAESLPGQRFSRLPQIHFKPSADEGRQLLSSSLESPMTMFKNKDNEGATTCSDYLCPLYRTSARAGTLSSTGHSTNFVTSITLPSNRPSEFWVLRGVAVLCQLDD